MFPIFWNTSYLKSNGDITTIGDEIGSGGGGGGSVLEPLTVTENGTYTPGSGVDGFNRVTVNVPVGNIPKLTRSEWDVLSYEQKRSYGELIIIDRTTGFLRGDYVIGSEFSYFPVIQAHEVEINDIYEENGIYYFDVTGLVAGGGAGIVVNCLNTNVSGVKLTIVDSDINIQYGICAKGSVLPNIITTGAGRVYYNTGGTGSTSNPSISPASQNIFFGQSQQAIGNFVISIEPITT